MNLGTCGVVFVHQKHSCMFFTFFCTMWLHDVLIYSFSRIMTIINAHYIFVPFTLRDHCIILHVFMFVGCQYCRKWISYNLHFDLFFVEEILICVWQVTVSWSFRLFPWCLLLGNTHQATKWRAQTLNFSGFRCWFFKRNVKIAFNLCWCLFIANSLSMRLRLQQHQSSISL